MADIPVEEESGGSNPWSWILGLIALALIVWGIWAWAADGEGEEAITTGEDVEAVDPGANAGGAGEGAPTGGSDGGGVITDLSTLTTGEGGRNFVGRRVQLSNLAVPQMLGDSLFNVSTAGDGGTQEDVLVVLNEKTQMEQGGVEGRYNVNEGQRLTVLEGSIQQLTSDVLTDQDVTGPDADQVMRDNEYYIRATRLNITAEG